MKKEIITPEFKTVFESETVISDNAKSWVYDKTEKEWVNRIVSGYTHYEDQQNFDAIKTALVKGGDENYYVVMYSYKNIDLLSIDDKINLRIYDDYIQSDRNGNVILKQGDIDKIREYYRKKKGVPLKISTKLCSGLSPKDDSSSISRHVKYKLYGDAFPKYKKTFWIEFETIDGEEVVRFRFPEDYSCSKGFFEKNYFEISMREFLKLFPNI